MEFIELAGWSIIKLHGSADKIIDKILNINSEIPIARIENMYNIQSVSHEFEDARKSIEHK